MKAKTFLPIFTGFYGSHWDEPCFDGEEDYFELPSDKDFWEFVDWDKYHEHIAREMCDEVQNLLSDFVSEITFEGIVSPKYYNFGNDSINCEIEADRFKIQEYLYENKNKFDAYIKDNYTSRDGFMSSYSNDSNEWMTEWHTSEHMFGAVLQFICINEGFEEPWDLNDCHVSLFYKDEIYQYETSH